MNKRNVLLFGLLIVGSLIACCFGKTPMNQIWTGVLARIHDTSQQWNSLLDERIPRIIVILCTGASLAVSGAVMQALFQNPLASPSVLGISCGGCLMVIPIFIFSLHVPFPYLVPLAAFCGCLFTLLLVYALAKQQGMIHMSNLILTGIAISTFFVSIQGAILYALRDQWQLIQLITEWEAGSTADRTWNHVHMQLPLTLVGLFGCWYYRQEINLLALGEEEALNLGVDVSKVRWRLFLCVALLTGGAIAALGVILFFGLVLPHIVRKLFGSDFMTLLPLCIYVGGLALLTMDLTLRLLDIQALSIGNISAILGGFFFLVILVSTRKKEHN
jgi:iron complex transport system permease protein